MADEADRAQAHIERMHDIAVLNARNAKREIQPNGACHYCKEPVDGKKLFCDGHCAADWERVK